MAQSIANVIARSDEVLAEVQPDAVLILGDTNSALSAICAKRRKIPIFHMEAGNRCFDQRVPEETNRKVVDHLSDINLPYTEHARRYLLAEGFPPDRVIKTGSPQFEVIEHHRADIAASDACARLGVQPGKYFVVSLHREENVDDEHHLHQLVESLKPHRPGVRVPVDRVPAPTDPQAARRHRPGNSTSSFDRYRRLGFADYVALQAAAYCTISDSGTITEEASMIGFPAVTVREAHERPEGMDDGVLIMSGLGADRLIESIRVARAHFEQFGPPTIPGDYTSPDVSWKIVKIILSYVDFVNRTVWSKPS